MGFRYLPESTSLDFLDSVNPSAKNSSVDIKPITYNGKSYTLTLHDFQGPAKLHVGMLTISLLAGLGYGGYVTYNCWREKRVFLSHIRNLVIALTCRTFFTVLFEGVIILESPFDEGGGNTLLSLECICANLVVAFWLTLTIYLHARVQRNFNSEPTLKLYMYGIPGVAVYFAMIWIFAMAATYPSSVWWMINYILCLNQWVFSSLRLLYLLIQSALVIDIGRMLMTKSFDNDTVSLLRKVTIMVAILVLLFWLQFGFSAGCQSQDSIQPYLYVYYFIDGTQCVFVCLVLFFFSKWVPVILDKLPNIVVESGETMESTFRSKDEALIRRDVGRGIVTIDSLFVTQESKRWTNSTSDVRGDIVYSSIVEPENLQKTIDLYKRLNVKPTDKVTIVRGEKFYDCDLKNGSKKSKSLSSQSLESGKNENIEKRGDEKVVKKSAFYSSKYLILDSKEKNIPKYLQTRPCSFPMGREDSNEKELQREPPTSLEKLGGIELVKKWLRDNSDNIKDAQQPAIKKHTKVEKKEENVLQNTPELSGEHRQSASESASNVVDSVLLETLFGVKNAEGNPKVADGHSTSGNSDISDASLHENSCLEKCNIKTSKDHTRTGTGYKEEVLDLRTAEEPTRVEQSDNINVTEADEKNVLQQTDNTEEEERKQNETVKQSTTKPECDEEKTKSQPKQIVRDRGDVTGGDEREKWEGRNADAINSNFAKSKGDGNPPETTPRQEKRIISPVQEFLNNTKGEVTADDIDAENSSASPTADSDLKNSPDVQRSSSVKSLTAENQEGSGALAGCITYSQLAAFRSQRDREKEKANEKGGALGLTSAIFSTLGAAINYGGSFFRSRNEDAWSK